MTGEARNKSMMAMNKIGIVCMPLVGNIPKPHGSGQWSKTKCPVCGRECWETNQFKWAKQAGIVNEAAYTECALKGCSER
jgi:hypothetical protein